LIKEREPIFFILEDIFEVFMGVRIEGDGALVGVEEVFNWNYCDCKVLEILLVLFLLLFLNLIVTKLGSL
jgi:hypothetical protein